MNSLESKIRDLMITIAKEHDQITLALDGRNEYEMVDKLLKRRLRLSKLASECIYNIDAEISFFKNN